MNILAIGDSFTYGEELKDRNNAWPQLIQQQTGCNVTNLGDPGAGNTRIIREIVSRIDDYDLFIIAWSHYARVEFADCYGVFDIWPGAINLFNHLPELAHRVQLIKHITRHHNDEYEFQQFLVNAIMLQNYLKCHDKKYIMVNTSCDDITDFIDNSLTDQLDKECFMGWPNESLQQWAKETPHGKGGHFLEEGHQLVAEKVYQDLRNKQWLP
jgi:hypothetical protein